MAADDTAVVCGLAIGLKLVGFVSSFHPKLERQFGNSEHTEFIIVNALAIQKFVQQKVLSLLKDE
jgi:hypothetical protein